VAYVDCHRRGHHPAHRPGGRRAGDGPACIVAGIGGILYQNRTGDWESWAFAWTLNPAFVGAGMVLSGLLGEDFPKSVREGMNLMVASIVLFLVFAAAFGRLSVLGPYRDYLLSLLFFLLGLWFIGQALIRPRR